MCTLHTAALFGPPFCPRRQRRGAHEAGRGDLPEPVPQHQRPDHAAKLVPGPEAARRVHAACMHSDWQAVDRLAGRRRRGPRHAALRPSHRCAAAVPRPVPPRPLVQPPPCPVPTPPHTHSPPPPHTHTQRVLLLDYSKESGRISMRHYSVAVAPSGVRWGRRRGGACGCEVGPFRWAGPGARLPQLCCVACRGAAVIGTRAAAWSRPRASSPRLHVTCLLRTLDLFHVPAPPPPAART